MGFFFHTKNNFNPHAKIMHYTLQVKREEGDVEGAWEKKEVEKKTMTKLT